MYPCLNHLLVVFRPPEQTVKIAAGYFHPDCLKMFQLKLIMTNIINITVTTDEVCRNTCNFSHIPVTTCSRTVLQHIGKQAGGGQMFNV